MAAVVNESDSHMPDWFSQQLYYIYVLPLIAFWILYAKAHARASKVSKEIQLENLQAGLDQPASLHPVVDPNVCIGCGACVNACPENNVLGLIKGKAELISPSNCIGHGACKTACPVGGIDLVFGTKKRGVDIPSLKPNFESSVPGIFIAGELGGMGLVRNAIEQGKQAVAEIVKEKHRFCSDRKDLIIVGAGPAGLAAGLAAKAAGLNYTILEQDVIGGTVAHFPRKKLVMTAPAILPLVGKMNFKETTKEALLDYWQTIIESQQLEICGDQRVDAIDIAGPDSFRVATNSSVFDCSVVLLCLGRRGTPRKLGVEGEDKTKVVYRLVDAGQYGGQHVLIVGGGDSALEAALAIADETDTQVSLSYRSDSFARAKPKNRQLIADAQSAGRVDIYFSSDILKIDDERVVLQTKDGERVLRNDAVIICAGGILPTGFLQSVGIQIETKYGTA